MDDIVLKNGILCGLLSTGLGIGGVSSESGEIEDGKLPSIDVLKVVNITGYNDTEIFLKLGTYTTVLSSSANYIPSQGYLIIGGFNMLDLEYWDDIPAADIRITVDGTVVYEGDVAEYFDEMCIDPPKAFQYAKSFEVVAKRKNCTDNMFIQLKDTMIVGI